MSKISARRATRLMAASVVGLAATATLSSCTPPGDYCGTWKSGSAQTSSRYSRVRVRTCFRIADDGVRAYSEMQADKPTSCNFSLSFSGPGASCNSNAVTKPSWAQLSSSALWINNGNYTARCDYGGASDNFNIKCWHPQTLSRGARYKAWTEACYDVKDDGQGNACLTGSNKSTFELQT